MKHLALFILLIFTGVGFSQEPALTLTVTTRDDDTNKKLTGATIEVYQDGKLFVTKSTDSRGQTPIIELPINHNYTVKIKKDGYVTKVAAIDASYLYPDDLDAFIPYPIETGLFKKVEEVDFSFLETTPMIKLFIADGGYQDFDRDYTKEMLKKIADLKEEMANKEAEEAEKRAEFDRYVANGDKSVGKEDYQDAVDQYTLALGIFTDAEVQSKLDDANAKLKAQEDAQANDKAYDDKMTLALADFEAKSYESSLKLYKEASALKPGEQAPKDKISQIEGILEKQKEDEAAYKKFLADGDTNVGSEKYDEAITNFEGALGLRPGDPDATAKLDNANKLKQDQADAEAKEKQLEEEYNNLIAAADASFDSKTYEDSKSKYEEALSLKPGEEKPTKRIAEIDEILKKIKEEEDAENAKNQAYVDKMSAAKSSFDGKKYEEALGLYTEASGMKPEESEPKAMIKEIDGILEKQKEDEAAYKKFLTDGDSDVTSENYDGAITNFESALDLRPGDPDATAKLENAKNLKQDKEDAEANEKKLNEDYDRLMAEADAEFGSDNFEEARAKYVEAKGLKPDQTKPQIEIDKIDKILADKKAEQDAEEQLNKQFNDLMTEADGLFDNKDWVKAKEKYEAAHNLKKEEQRPLDRIALANQEIENDKLQTQRDEDYQAAMDEGNDLLDQKKYEEARSKYNIASGLKSDEQEPKDKINQIDQLLSDMANDAEKEENYQKAMKEGNSLKDNKDYVAAITSYKSALTYKPDDSEAQSKIDDINAIIEADQKAKEEQEKFEDFVTKAETAFSATNYVDAKLNYNSALEIKEDPAIRTKLAEIDELMAKEQDQAQIDADYDAAIKEGANLFSAEDYNAALAKYKEAEALKSSELLPKEKISEINELLDELKAKEEEDKKFKDLVSAGDQFNEDKDYAKAIAKYKEALIIRQDQDVSKKIADIGLIIAEQDQNAETQKLYEAKLAEAKLEFDAKNWVAAKNKYNEASNIKSSESFPIEQIALIDQLMEAEADQANEQAYQDMITKADGSRDGDRLDEAINFYEQAKNLKSSDPYPQNEIDKINQIKADRNNDLAEKDRLDNEYNDLVNKANSAYNSEDFSSALISYKEANSLRPNDSYVKGRLDDVNAKLANLDEESRKRAEYEGFIGQADEKFNSGEYLESIPFYEQARGVLPNEAYPKNQIAEAERLEKEEGGNEAEDLYQKILSKAQEKFELTDYDGALNLYNRALTIKSDDPLPQQKIDEINQILANQDADKLRKEYDDLMVLADSQFEQSKWKEAKEYYEQALTKIKEQRPVDQIAICEQFMKDEGEIEINDQYNKIITKADQYFTTPNYEKAKNLYERALTIKPTDQYPKDQLLEIDKILHPEKYVTDSGPLVDRGTPINSTDLEMEKALREAREEKEFRDGQFTVRVNEEIEKTTTDLTEDQHDEVYKTKDETDKLEIDIEENIADADEKREESVIEVVEMEDALGETKTNWTEDQHDEVFLTKDETDKLEIDIEENIADADEKREESLVEVVELEDALGETKTNWTEDQDDEVFLTKDETDKLEIDIEENIADADEKREESNVEVIAMEDDLDLKSREYGIANENDIQQQNQIVENLFTDIEESNDEDDLPREEYLTDVENIKEEIDYENEVNSNAQNNNNFDAKDEVEDLQLKHISNDPNNDIDRKNTEVNVTNFESELIDESTENGKNQDDEVNNVVNQNELLTDERLAEDVGNDIPRIENVKDVDELYTENADVNRGQANDQYDATMEGKKHEENLMVEIEINNRNNDIPRQDMELVVDESEIAIEDKIENLTNDQNDILYTSDSKLEDIEVDIEDQFIDADEDRQEYEDVVEDLNMEIQDFKDNLGNDSEDNMHSTEDYTEKMEDDKVSFEKDSDDKINEAIDQTNGAVDDIIDENNKIGEEATDKRNETEDYIEKMQLQFLNLNDIDQEMQNQLGKEFPEGVTEEVYEYKDDDGLLEKYVVRRIVVVNGVGYVYEKVMTRYGVSSYSRNGDGITEYQWDSETNNADLIRN